MPTNTLLFPDWVIIAWEGLVFISYCCPVLVIVFLCVFMSKYDWAICKVIIVDVFSYRIDYNMFLHLWKYWRKNWCAHFAWIPRLLMMQELVNWSCNWMCVMTLLQNFQDPYKYGIDILTAFKKIDRHSYEKYFPISTLLLNFTGNRSN